MRLLFMMIVLCTTTMFGQTGQVYQIYTNKGKKVSFDKMVSELGKTDIVLFGEYHNNSIGHWLQLKFTEELGKKHKLVLGAEMFEADNQASVSAYVEGKISEEDFVKDTRLWANYKTDYKPLVEYAKQNQLAFVATNVPRRYASLVFKGGTQALDSLSSAEKQWIAPLPFAYDANLPGYKKMLSMFEDHKDENLPKAQAVKDATMGYFISQNSKVGDIFVHYNGSYHSNSFEGIVWYLNQYAPTHKVGTITMIESNDVGKWENENLDLANFIIIIDAQILKSF